MTWRVLNEPQVIRCVVRTLEREALGPVAICYEAGPVGTRCTGR